MNHEELKKDCREELAALFEENSDALSEALIAEENGVSGRFMLTLISAMNKHKKRYVFLPLTAKKAEKNIQAMNLLLCCYAENPDITRPYLMAVIEKISYGSKNGDYRFAFISSFCLAFGIGIQCNYRRAIKLLKKHRKTYLECDILFCYLRIKVSVDELTHQESLEIFKGLKKQIMNVKNEDLYEFLLSFFRMLERLIQFNGCIPLTLTLSKKSIGFASTIALLVLCADNTRHNF